MERPILRKLNYISSYFNDCYQYYQGQTANTYYTNYYSLDYDNSIYESDQLRGGSYEKLGIGNLSGIQFKKILMFPVTGVQQVTPTADSGETGGLTYADSMMTSVLIPQIYGMKPVEGDFINLNFGFNSDKDSNKTLYVVSNVNLAHHGDYLNIYYCSLQIAPVNITEVEKQISAYYSFYEPTKEILKLTNANLLNKITTRGESVTSNLQNIFNEKVNFYLESTEIIEI